MDALLRRVQVLEAERDIAQLMATYSRLVDTGPDADAIAALFTPDAVYETFGYLGRERGADGPITGREAIRATFRALPEMLPFTAHFLCNPQITVDADGSTGRGQWLALELANAAHDDGRVPLVLVAQYDNDFVHEDDTGASNASASGTSEPSATTRGSPPAATCRCTTCTSSRD